MPTKPKPRQSEYASLAALADEAARTHDDIGLMAEHILRAHQFDAQLLRLGADQAARDACARLRRSSLAVLPVASGGGPADSPASRIFNSPTADAYAWPIAGKPLGDCTAGDLREEIERRRGRAATDMRIADALAKIMRRMVKAGAATVRDGVAREDVAKLLRSAPE